MTNRELEFGTKVRLKKDLLIGCFYGNVIYRQTMYFSGTRIVSYASTGNTYFLHNNRYGFYYDLDMLLPVKSSKKK